MILALAAILILLKNFTNLQRISQTEDDWNPPQLKEDLIYPKTEMPEQGSFSAIAEKDVFFKHRGVTSPKLTPEQEAAAKKAAEEAEAKRKAEEAAAAKKAAEEAEAKRKAEEEANRIKPASAYPDEWPRLKLTAVFQFDDGSYGVIIEGGKTIDKSSGNVYSGIFRLTDEVGSGVFLHEIKQTSVVLVKNKVSWQISLGAQPPAVKKK